MQRKLLRAKMLLELNVVLLLIPNYLHYTTVFLYFIKAVINVKPDTETGNIPPHSLRYLCNLDINKITDSKKG